MPQQNPPATERRRHQRRDANGLGIEIRRRNWLGRWQKPHHAIGLNLSPSGLAILSPVKLRVGQTLLLSIGNRHQRLQALPAVVIHVEPRDGDFIYGLKIHLDDLGQNARQSYDTVLQLIQDSVAH